MASDDHQYLTVPNWKKHQHRDLADKGDMPWFKLDSGIFDDPAIADLNAVEFRAYVRALTLAARTGNKLPASVNWLRAHFGRSWVQLCTTLVRNSLLSGTLPPQKALQKEQTGRAAAAPSPSLEERRGEKRQPLHQPQPNNELDVTGQQHAEEDTEQETPEAILRAIGTIWAINAGTKTKHDDVPF